MKTFLKSGLACLMVCFMIVGCSSNDSKKETKTETETTDNDESQTGETVGTLVSTNGTKLVLKTNEGESLTFDTSSAKFNLKNGMEVGNWIHVEYIGEIDGTDASNVKVTEIIDDADNTAVKEEQSKATIKDASGTVYAIAGVHVRASYTTSSQILGSLATGTAVERTGTLESGWTRIKYNGQDAFVVSKCLSDKKPAQKTTEGTATPAGVERTTDGKVKHLTNNLLTIDHKGLTFVFDITTAKQNYTGSLVSGKEVTITFNGDLDGRKTMTATAVEDASNTDQ